MAQEHWLVERFQEHRGRLRKVAYRMLGTDQEADDAVQEAWLRLSQADAGAVGNLGGWLTTVVARVCLDMLRSRDSRREAPLEASAPVLAERAVDSERDLLLADSIDPALLVVLETLGPAERVAFVGETISGIELIVEPERLVRIDVELEPDGGRPEEGNAP